ncbi:MAG: hypothetical protein CMJ78_11435 [Planctomycetaceae bacterium]|nr:hypothetical protein [Planctomycetaceae bacterium]
MPSGPLRADVLVELIRVDLEARANSNVTIPLADYLERYPQLADSRGAIMSLLLDDYSLKQRHGIEAALEDYAEQFSDYYEELGVDPTSSPTSVADPNTEARHLELEPGSSLGDFEIVRTLGSGGSAKVFLARQTAHNRLVAIKVSEGRGQEANTLAQLQHENIIRVFSEEVIERYHVLVMRYEPGITMAELLTSLNDLDRRKIRRHDILRIIDVEYTDVFRVKSPSESRQPFIAAICTLMQSLMQAVEYVHGKGYLHRDIKPENVLLTRDSKPLLMDFNVAVKKESLTEDALLGGTLAYMAPEHLLAITGDGEESETVDRDRAEQVDESSDVYSLGVVFYELLVGQRPYVVDETAQSLMRAARNAC